MESNQHFKVEDNSLKMKHPTYPFSEGVQLNREEEKYLLPHFLLLLVGKPGSGKTALLKQLLTNKQMYKKKFDYVFLLSPSFAKMELKLKPANMTSQFSLDWIYTKIEEINKKQLSKGDKNNKDSMIFQGKGEARVTPTSKNKLIDFNILSNLNKLGSAGAGRLKQKNAVGTEIDQQQLAMQEWAQKLTPEERKRRYVNVLFVLDDMVADLKKNETNPKLSQLIMNRRHLVSNGTVSLILVTQKYTMIPARIRSNASWLILFKLNPLDIENVYKDVITFHKKKWEALVNFIFEDDLVGGGSSKRSHPGDQDEVSDRGDDDDDDDERGVEEEQKQLIRDEDKYGYVGQQYDVHGEVIPFSAVKQRQIKKKKSSSSAVAAINIKGPGFQDSLAKKRHDSLGVWVEFGVFFKNFKRLVLTNSDTMV